MPDDDATAAAPAPVSSAARFWYMVMNIGLGSGYFAKIPTKKALADAGMATMTSAERFWYALMCVSLGAGYFLKIPAAKALSESTLAPALAGAAATPQPPPSRRAPILAIVAAVVACIATTTAIWSFVGGQAEPAEPAASIATAPPSWYLDGIYRIDLDYPNQIVRSGRGEFINLGGQATAESVYVARKTVCDEEDHCTTLSIPFNQELGRPESDERSDIGRFRWTGTRWVTDGDGPNRGVLRTLTCTNRAGEEVPQQWESWSEMIPLMDGTFLGTSRQQVMTDECESGGESFTTPITVTRGGDAPAGIFD